MEENNHPSAGGPNAPSASPTEALAKEDQPPKSKLPILTGIIVAVLVIVGTASAAYLLLNKKSEPVACTMEAKLCPDGSSVGRTGPKCEFAPCPTSSKNDETTSWKTYTNSAYSFRYPSDWDTQSMGKNVLMVAPKKIVEEVRKTEGGFGGGTFLTLMIYDDDKVPADWFKSDETKEVSRTEIVMGELPATRYILKFITDIPGIPQGSIITDIIFNRNGSLYRVELLDNSYQHVFDQILSTFKFTPPAGGSNSTPTCTPGPSCFYTPPYCEMFPPEPAGGWCP